MRRKDDTMRDALLECARQVADAEGIDAINIRALAGRAGVAAGTVYNYFANKDEILLALTETYWRQAFEDMHAAIGGDCFCGQLRQIYAFLQRRIAQSAGKLMNSLGNVEPAGQARMAAMQAALESALIRRMDQDAAIREDGWSEAFTRQQFARFVMMNMVALLKAGAPDIDFLIAVIKRSIY